jgi:hypothetical protein
MKTNRPTPMARVNFDDRDGPVTAILYSDYRWRCKGDPNATRFMNVMFPVEDINMVVGTPAYVLAAKAAKVLHGTATMLHRKGSKPEPDTTPEGVQF